MDPEDSVLCTQACDDKDDRKDCRAVSGIICVAKKPGELPEKEREELRRIITDIFQEKMKKRNIK